MKKIRLFEYDEFLVAQLPYIPKDIKDLKRKKLERFLKKAKLLLLKNGAEKIVLTRELKDYPYSINDVFFMFAHEVVVALNKYFKIQLPFKLYVKQKNPDERALFVAEKLIFDASEVGVLTDEKTVIYIADRLLKEYGEYPKCFPYEYIPKDGIMVNLDESSILVDGKWKTEDFVISEETRGYNIDGAELHQIKYGNFDKIQIKECKCGKKKLTLIEK
ncbi:MAG: hypothetical protein E7415_06310 [Ruminococcaceae bacterium]|nr:hypothetical protein [Oscillospiraceae bacterium]